MRKRDFKPFESYLGDTHFISRILISYKDDLGLCFLMLSLTHSVNHTALRYSVQLVIVRYIYTWPVKPFIYVVLYETTNN